MDEARVVCCGDDELCAALTRLWEQTRADGVVLSRVVVPDVVDMKRVLDRWVNTFPDSDRVPRVVSLVVTEAPSAEMFWDGVATELTGLQASPTDPVAVVLEESRRDEGVAVVAGIPGQLSHVSFHFGGELFRLSRARGPASGRLLVLLALASDCATADAAEQTLEHVPSLVLCSRPPAEVAASLADYLRAAKGRHVRIEPEAALLIDAFAQRHALSDDALAKELADDLISAVVRDSQQLDAIKVADLITERDRQSSLDQLDDHLESGTADEEVRERARTVLRFAAVQGSRFNVDASAAALADAGLDTLAEAVLRRAGTPGAILHDLEAWGVVGPEQSCAWLATDGERTFTDPRLADALRGRWTWPGDLASCQKATAESIAARWDGDPDPDDTHLGAIVDLYLDSAANGRGIIDAWEFGRAHVERRMAVHDYRTAARVSRKLLDALLDAHGLLESEGPHLCGKRTGRFARSVAAEGRHTVTDHPVDLPRDGIRHALAIEYEEGMGPAAVRWLWSAASDLCLLLADASSAVGDDARAEWASLEGALLTLPKLAPQRPAGALVAKLRGTVDDDRLAVLHCRFLSRLGRLIGRRDDGEEDGRYLLDHAAATFSRVRVRKNDMQAKYTGMAIRLNRAVVDLACATRAQEPDPSGLLVIQDEFKRMIREVPRSRRGWTWTRVEARAGAATALATRAACSGRPVRDRLSDAVDAMHHWRKALGELDHLDPECDGFCALWRHEIVKAATALHTRLEADDAASKLRGPLPTSAGLAETTKGPFPFGPFASADGYSIPWDRTAKVVEAPWESGSKTLHREAVRIVVREANAAKCRMLRLLGRGLDYAGVAGEVADGDETVVRAELAALWKGVGARIEALGWMNPTPAVVFRVVGEEMGRESDGIEP